MNASTYRAQHSTWCTHVKYSTMAKAPFNSESRKARYIKMADEAYTSYVEAGGTNPKSKI